VAASTQWHMQIQTAHSYETIRLCHGSAAAVVAGESRMMLRGSWIRGDSAEAPPERFKVLPWGETKTRDGALVVNDEAAQTIEARMKASRRDVVRIDREHATAFVPALKRNPRDILGYGKLEVVKGEGVFLSSVRWTPEGKEVWAALPDVSPSFNFRKQDNLVTNLESVALCCDGEIEGLTLLSADAADSAGIYLEPTDDSMKELLLQLLAKAGVEVPEGATDADIQALAMKHLEGGKPADKKDDESAAAMSAQEARLKKLEDALAARQASDDKAEREELKRKASAEGKVIPLTDEQIAETDVKTLSAIVAGLPAGQVPLEGKSGKPAGESQKAGEKVVTLTAADKQMCELYSLSEEDFKKYAAA
jgi:phage I-like protein